MRVSIAILLLFLTGSSTARSSGRPSSSASRRSPSKPSRQTPSSQGRRRSSPPSDELDDFLSDEEDDDNLQDEYDDYEEEDVPPPRSRSRSSSSQQRPSSRRRHDDPPHRSRSSRNTNRPPSRRNPHTVVPYSRSRQPQPTAFTRGLSAIRDRIPDPSTVKSTVLSATKSAQQTTSKLSSSLYREVKGLTSSELEQVMLKATRPDDDPVKSKHVERLVGVTYQISGKYDIYDAVLRKLWNKMAEKDVRTKLKSVYVLHRFSVDGGSEHREALKQRLRALRKTRDPKKGGGTRYFDSKVLIGVDEDPDTQGYRAFLSRYAHYVLTRAQTFGGIFNEISLAQQQPSSPPPSSKTRSKSRSNAAASSSSSKPKNPPLSSEHLKFAQMVLKAGLACSLHDGEECESTAMCVERVAADLMGLTSAVAVALKRELKSENDTSEDGDLIRQWCEFYSEELLPDTKKFVKKTSSKLDVYGLYLPSRMSASLPQELLEKGLKLGGGGGGEVKKDDKEEVEDDGEEEEPSVEQEKEEVAEESAECKTNAEGDVSLAMSSNREDEELGDEYDEEYYDEYEEEDE